MQTAASPLIEAFSAGHRLRIPARKSLISPESAPVSLVIAEHAHSVTTSFNDRSSSNSAGTGGEAQQQVDTASEREPVCGSAFEASVMLLQSLQVAKCAEEEELAKGRRQQHGQSANEERTEEARRPSEPRVEADLGNEDGTPQFLSSNAAAFSDVWHFVNEQFLAGRTAYEAVSDSSTIGTSDPIKTLETYFSAVAGLHGTPAEFTKEGSVDGSGHVVVAAATADMSVASASADGNAGLLPLFSSLGGGIGFQFAGQGGSDYLNEIRNARLVAPAAVNAVVESVTASLRALISAGAAAFGQSDKPSSAESDQQRVLPSPPAAYFRWGFDVLDWIDGRESQKESSGSGTPQVQAPANSLPDDAYLRSAPISFPLILLAQVCTFVAFLQSARLSFKHWTCLMRSSDQDMFAPFVGVTGHSQGLMAAAVIAGAHSLDDILSRVDVGARALFFAGARAQQVSDTLASEAKRQTPTVLLDFLQSQRERRARAAGRTFASVSVGEPTPLLSVRGMSPSALSVLIKSTNEALRLPKEAQLRIALINGERSCVVGGAALFLRELFLDLQEHSSSESQARVPHSQRKPACVAEFVQTTAPFHTPTMRFAVDAAVGDCKCANLVLSSDSLSCAVFSTADGADLRDLSSLTEDRTVANGTSPTQTTKHNLLPMLLDLALHAPVKWTSATNSFRAASTRVLDFGPGRGVASITARTLEGFGCRVFSATPLAARGPAAVGLATVSTLSEALSTNGRLTATPHSWVSEFGPKLCQTARIVDNNADPGDVQVSTAFSRLTGKPPVMVAGMTPTTSFNGTALVAACSNAGYFVELAGGGLPRPSIFRSHVIDLTEQLRPGAGFSLNLLYLNAKQWAFQFPMVAELRSEGVPIEGVTIGAGIPSPERATEIISALQSCGVRWLGLKPGSEAAINAVIEIARENPGMHIILQWTGGRAGGHHSFEDMHEPILATYASIRHCRNVVLVAGSGIGDTDSALPYLCGTWSCNFGVAPMPYDAVLLASRMMVCAEAATAVEVKQLLVDTPGISAEEQFRWEESYAQPVGGIVTVNSELGEPIHVVATRGMRLWKEFDDRYFSLARGDARRLAIIADREYIVRRINEDYQKPFFPQVDGAAFAGITDMTYAAVLRRMVSLMFVISVAGRGRWLDPTYESRMVAFARRLTERFAESSGDSGSVVRSDGSDFLDADTAKSVSRSSPLNENTQHVPDPLSFLRRLFRFVPAAESRLVIEEDSDYFLHLCANGGKPVNFIPVIDEHFDVWFKKDSLWYSEDLSAVPSGDPDRTCILQGPVAARFSTIVNEPAATILNRMRDGFVASSKSFNPLPLATVPSRDRTFSRFPGIRITHNGEVAVDSVDEVDISQWFEILAGQVPWRRALLLSAEVGMHDSANRVQNHLRSLFKPRIGQQIEGALDNGDVLVFRDSRIDQSGKPTVSASFIPSESRIRVNVFDNQVEKAHASLELVVFFDPTTPLVPIREVGSRTSVVKDFYRQMWFDDAETDTPSVFDELESEFCVSSSDVQSFVQAIYADGTTPNSAPMDFAIVACWRSLILALFCPEVEGDLLELVHLSNSFRRPQSSIHSFEHAIKAESKLSTRMRVKSLRNTAAGKVVNVAGAIYNSSGQPSVDLMSSVLLEVESAFLFRGQFKDHESSFVRESGAAIVDLKNSSALALLQSQSWHVQSEDGVQLGENDAVRILYDSIVSFGATGSVCGVKTTGRTVRISSDEDTGSVGDGAELLIGRIEVNSPDATHDAVALFCRDFGQPCQDGSAILAPDFFESGGYNMLNLPDHVIAPIDNLPYALASRDLNPIHRHPYIADLALLPDTIVHGMWTSANARRVVENHAANGVSDRIRSFNCEFVGMVLPGDSLFTQLRHTGMRQGRMIVEFRTARKVDGNDAENESSSSELVLKGTAEIDQPLTAYVFTGQGSAEQGMGMDSYRESVAARELWDRADSHLLKTFGFSILDIVRTNPKKLRVNFGGARGAAIRRNLMDLKCTDASTGETVALLPEITDRSRFFDFIAPDTGLLFATQFTQPALVLLEKAAFEMLREKQLVPAAQGFVFAGHSLGEYAALASAADVLSIETLVELVFLRGMTMQKAVPRDPVTGRSNFGMVAANPLRVSPFFNDEQLAKLVECIGETTKELLEVVNLNVRGLQFVIAGTIRALEVLSEAMTAIAGLSNGISSSLTSIVVNAMHLIDARPRPLQLRRGHATIPLPGIDVPFHSRYLRPGVATFRQTLRGKLSRTAVARALPLLENRYIPNVIAKPFALTRAFVAEAVRLTESPALEAILESWESANKIEIAYELVVELLAYQFASPVRWIETQQEFFGPLQVQRFVEIGPAATLATMAKRTLEQLRELELRTDHDVQSTGMSKMPFVEVLFVGKDGRELEYGFDDRGPDALSHVNELQSLQRQSEAGIEAPQPSVPEPPSAPTGTSVTATPAPDSKFSAGNVTTRASVVADSYPCALEVVRILLGVKLKKPLSEIPADSTIAMLVGGKSAMQNEILGDFEIEFGRGVFPDGSHERPLKELAAIAEKAGYPDSPKDAGKLSAAAVAKLASSRLPGGFSLSSAKSYLESEWHVGPGRAFGVLLYALLIQPSSRLEDVGAAKAWLDEACAHYSSHVGVELSKAVVSQPGFSGPSDLSSILSLFGTQASPSTTAVGPVIDDKPLEAVHVLRIILALKLKKSLHDVATSATVHALCGGKSAAQNEIIGDFAVEFGDRIPSEGAAETSLSQLGDIIDKNGSYTPPGKFLQGTLAKLVSSKMPAGFALSSMRNYVQSEWGLGAHGTTSVLMFGLLCAPPARLDSSEAAKKWLDDAVALFGKEIGLNLVRTSASGSGNGAGASSSIDASMLANLLRGTKNEVPASVLSPGMRRMIDKQIAALSEFVEKDDFADARTLEAQTAAMQSVQQELELWRAEHGGEEDGMYERGIAPLFAAAKIRSYDAYWNWSIQDAIRLFSSCVLRHHSWSDVWGRQIRRQLIRRADPQLLAVVRSQSRAAGVLSDWRLQQGPLRLAEMIEAQLNSNPVYVAFADFNVPQVRISQDGVVSYAEGPRPGVASPLDYVLQLQDKALLSVRWHNSADQMATSNERSDLYFRALREVVTDGISFAGRIALVTGASKDSIAADIVRALLEGGATVLVTTSSFGRENALDFYRQLYERHGAKGSVLKVMPFNQGSQQDIQALLAHVYDTLELDLDIVVPFAAISENGRSISEIDSRSELAHRVMLTNVTRLLGAIRVAKESRGIRTRPATVLLPLSPNHGLFGGDGLYAESKLGLEALLNKWYSEDWSDFLSLVGCVIGWTRGTGLMAANNIVAPGIEELGLRTFSTAEMAINLTALLHDDVVDMASVEGPLWADFGGGFGKIPNLKSEVDKVRASVQGQAAAARILSGSRIQDTRSVDNVSRSRSPVTRACHAFEGARWPALPLEDSMSQLAPQLEGMVDLARTVVITGFGEVGPWGSSRTRWELEANGALSLEGCIELAWVTGLIKYSAGVRLSSGETHIGWVDTATGDALSDLEIKSLYEERLLKHSGVRLIEPELVDGYKPDQKVFMHEVAIEHDMDWIEVADLEEADQFRNELGRERCDVRKRETDGQWLVRLRKGAVLSIPKALKFDRTVAGQIPTGWDPKILGIPDDIVQQVDPVTLFTLVSTAEALMCAGIPSAYELYKYVHVSEVGNTSGGGMGGMRSLKRIFRERREGKGVQGDILQESFINTMPAWVNMLLLSSSGPIKTPVGACATAAESIEMGFETIRSGKARVVVVGGFDDFGEEGSYEFAQMKATSSASAEADMGRYPNEACRPCTDTRGGFMEAQGAGIQILMSAQLAIDMGCPIFGVIGHVSTATDREGRSVPAPGQGIMTTAREVSALGDANPLLDIGFRRTCMEREIREMRAWCDAEVNRLEASAIKQFPPSSTAQSVDDQKKLVAGRVAFVRERASLIMREASRLESSVRSRWGNDFFVGEQSIAPLRGALAVWGLGVDDIAVASFHGTGTQANDYNESEVTQRQMERLGRSPGNPLLVICQKWLTGHPKGAAAAWMTNGLLQTLTTGRIPGNRNADNVDSKLRKFTHLAYPNQSLTSIQGVNATLLKSFGFGQAGAEVLLINPKFVLATLAPEVRAAYALRRDAREREAHRSFQKVITGKEPLCRVKTRAPYTPEQQDRVYLDPTARTAWDPSVGDYVFPSTPSAEAASTAANAAALAAAGSVKGQSGFSSPVPESTAFGGGATATLLASLALALETSVEQGTPDEADLQLDSSVDSVLLRSMGRKRATPYVSHPSQATSAGTLEIPDVDPLSAVAPPRARIPAATRLAVATRSAAAAASAEGFHDPGTGIGIDVEAAKTFDGASEHFLARNFTPEERAYAEDAPQPSQAYAGRWAAKEAVIKAISSLQPEGDLWVDAAAPLKDIAILRTNGAPFVRLSGHAQRVAELLGVKDIKVSITHAGGMAFAQALTRR